MLLCQLKLGETGREECFVHQQLPLGDAKAFSLCWTDLDLAVININSGNINIW